MSKINSPWRLDNNETPLRIVDADDFIVCSMYPSGLADATLIAAAPDLLRELKHLVSLVEPCISDGRASIPGLATFNAAHAAIAKAEGKE